MRTFLSIVIGLVLATSSFAQPYWGNFPDGGTLYFYTNTISASGAPATPASEAVAVYKDNSATELTAGVSIDDDFDGRTGFHQITIDTTQTGFDIGSLYTVVYTAGTSDSVSLAGRQIGSFWLGPKDSNVTHWLGTAAATPTVPGVPEVDTTHYGGIAQTGRDLGARISFGDYGEYLHVGIGQEYATITAAVAAASAVPGGDLVVIHPGSYDEQMIDTTPDFYFLHGASIDSTDDNPLFNPASARRVYVYGYGRFSAGAVTDNGIFGEVGGIAPGAFHGYVECDYSDGLLLGAGPADLVGTFVVKAKQLKNISAGPFIQHDGPDFVQSVESEDIDLGLNSMLVDVTTGTVSIKCPRIRVTHEDVITGSGGRVIVDGVIEATHASSDGLNAPSGVTVVAVRGGVTVPSGRPSLSGSGTIMVSDAFAYDTATATATNVIDTTGEKIRTDVAATMAGAGRTWFVAASGGNDANEGTTRTAALATWTEAQSRAVFGDTVHFIAGNYDDITITKAGLTVQGDGIGQTIFTTTSAANAGAIEVSSNADHTTLRHLECTTSGTGAIGIQVNSLTDGSNPNVGSVIEFVKSHGSGDAVICPRSRGLRISNSIFTSTFDGIACNAARELLIENSSLVTTVDTTRSAALFAPEGATGIVRNCTLKVARTGDGANGSRAVAHDIGTAGDGHLVIEDSTLIVMSSNAAYTGSVAGVGTRQEATDPLGVTLVRCKLLTQNSGTATPYDVDASFSGSKVKLIASKFDPAKLNGTANIDIDWLNTDRTLLTDAKNSGDTLTTRLSSARALLLDKLNITGNVAGATPLATLQTSATLIKTQTDKMGTSLIPDGGGGHQWSVNALELGPSGEISTEGLLRQDHFDAWSEDAPTIADAFAEGLDSHGYTAARAASLDNSGAQVQSYGTVTVTDQTNIDLPDAPSIDDWGIDYTLVIDDVSNPGMSDSATITAYNGGTKTATIDGAMLFEVVDGDTYRVMLPTGGEGGGLTTEESTKLAEAHTAVTSGTHGNVALKTAVDEKATPSNVTDAKNDIVTVLGQLEVDGVADFTVDQRAQVLAALSVTGDIGVHSSLVWNVRRIDGSIRAQPPIVIDPSEVVTVACRFNAVLAAGDAIVETGGIVSVEVVEDEGHAQVTSPAFLDVADAELWMNSAVTFKLSGGTTGKQDQIKIKVLTVGGDEITANVFVRPKGE